MFRNQWSKCPPQQQKPIGYFQVEFNIIQIEHITTSLTASNPGLKAFKFSNSDPYITNISGWNVLSFELDPTKQFSTRAYSHLDPLSFRKLITAIPADTQEKLVALLHLPELSSQDKIDIETARNENARVCVLNNRIREQNIESQQFDLHQAAGISILQGEYAVTDASNTEKYIIGSYGAGPCVMVFMWHDKENDMPARGIVAHIDAITDINSLFVLEECFSHFSTKPSIWLIGGNDGTYNHTAIQLYDHFSNRNYTELQCRIGKNTSAASLDVQSGKIMLNAFPIYAGECEDRRLQIAGLRQPGSHLKCEYDGRRYHSKKTSPTKVTTFFSGAQNTTSKNDTLRQTYCGLNPGFLIGKRF